MKKLLIFTFAILLFSCEKEKMIIDPPSELENITLESLKKLLPLEQSESKTKAVFYNSQGKEIIFDFELEQEEKEKIIEGKSYSTEEISAKYQNESITNYYLSFAGFGNYTKLSDPPTVGILASIRQTVEPTSTLLTLDDTGAIILGEFYEEKQLLDKEFSNVYSNLIVDEFTSFSELYYNASFGIIGFKDRSDDLYVFKEFAD